MSIQESIRIVPKGEVALVEWDLVGEKVNKLSTPVMKRFKEVLDELSRSSYKAVVMMNINTKYNQIPSDSDASIYTQGLLGGKFIGLTAGGSETYLKDKDQIDFTQSAFVLENLIGQFLANAAKGQTGSTAAKADAPAAPAEKTK